jgi:subtilisin family serine protease
MMLLILSGLTSTAFAQSFPVIVEIKHSANINAVVTALGGTLLDSMSGNVYLVSVHSIPSVYPTGVEYIELDTVQMPAKGIGAVFKVGANTPADFYQNQPAMQHISLPGGLSIATGRGVVIADINAQVDVRHPALIGHLTSGAQFLQGACSPGATLNQSDTAFLDQSDTAFLDQSDTAFLDQSDTAFLDQSDTAFLDQSTASFLDQMSPAHGHGTMVAGILAAVAPDAMIMPLRAFDDRGCGSIYNIAKAVRYAVNHGAQVINMSFGVTGEGHTLQNAIADAVKAGVTVVASAGNDNTAAPQYPAAYPGVLSVAATDLADAKAPFSNFGSTVFVSAPGTNIISAYPGGYYAELSGTSFSAPMVAGEAALLRSEKTSGWTRSIATGVVNIDAVNPNYVGQLGSGRIDLVKALQ